MPLEMSATLNDGLVELFEEDEDASAKSPLTIWRVLVVDDDAEVHRATQFALAGLELLGRPLVLEFASSAQEAEHRLLANPDVAVILLDVVMETNDAGLQFVERVRGALGLDEPRIILRTGQPGYAPELEVINAYDINDYRTKSDLTQTRLITSLTTALRSYRQIRAINEGHLALRTIISATHDFLLCKGLRSLGESILPRISELLRQPVSGLVVGLVGNDAAEPTILAANGDYAGYLNRPLAALPERQIADLVRQSLREKELAESGHGLALYCEGGDYPLSLYVDFHPSPDDDKREFLRLFCANIGLCSANQALIDRLHSDAYYDRLSGLPNRNRLVEELTNRFGASAEPQKLALIDMDHFNSLVETLGTEVSDRLLAAIGGRLRESFRDEPIYLARTGGDTFAMLGPGRLLEPQRLRSVFAAPFQVDDLTIPLTVTTGLAPLEPPCPSPMSTLSGAYTALKRAKYRQRGGYQHYTVEMSEEIAERAAILRDLRGAIDGSQFFLAMQPQLSLADERLLGFEALIRWRQADGRFVPPMEFIPVAESSGMILEIGAWVFRAACAHLAALRPQLSADIQMAINVSVAQLHDPGFLPMVEAALSDSGVPPGMIEIEITESMAMAEIGLVLSRIDQIKDMGLRIALDDFGTGFSSLAYLQRLRIDRLKIDRSFVNEIGCSARGERIAMTVVELGRHLDLEVLAEGIETDLQADYLRSVGCHAAQGYLYAKPMEIARLEDWLRSRSGE